MPGRPAIELTGQRFTRLAVIERCGTAHSGHALWLCKCDCGELHAATSACLRGGGVQSCGCLAKDKTREWRKTHQPGLKHGHKRRGAESPTYKSWSSMMRRCYGKRATQYKYYGGRGIRVCSRWRDFIHFLSDMGERPSRKHCLSRDGDIGNYEPGNATWQLKSENLAIRNARREKCKRE